MTIRYNGSIIAGSGGGGANPDETTIDLNSEEKLEALGTINKNTSSSIDSMYNWIGTLQEYNTQNIETLHPEWICFITDDVTTHTPPSRNLGEIVQSTIPLIDAGLHLLDGSLISSGSYADFVDYIAGLVSTYPDIFETEANWQTAVTTYGVCGKFVYDSVNNTVRLPKITGFTEGTIDPTTLGDLTQAGLPNITGKFTLGSAGQNSSIVGYWQGDGAFSSDAIAAGMAVSGYGSSSTQRRGTFDASRSSSIYGNSTTVQPQSIKLLYYVCIATATKTQIEVDIDEIATDLNGKADVNLVNVVSGAFESIVGVAQASGKETVVGWSVPDYTAGISMTSPYTVPSNGFLIFIEVINGGTSSISINGIQLLYVQSGGAWFSNEGCYPVKAGDVVTFDGNCKFFPASK